jgi:hypothetical protein
MDAEVGIDAAGVSVRPDRSLRIGSLRHFDSAGAFVEGLAGLMGGALPKPLEVVRRWSAAGGSEILLGWRSPTETLMISGCAAIFAAVERYAVDRSDGCFVDQSSGVRAWMVSGDRCRELLTRLGAPTAIPAPGGCVTGRLAELTVTSLSLRSGETLLLVERVYSAHLMAWIRATLADF